jgi:glycosyltransferase involved in cell wall biosynthesis
MNQRRKWLLLSGEYPPLLGGVGDYTRRVARGLAGRGNEVLVAAGPAGGDGSTANPAEATDPGLSVLRLPDVFARRGLARLSGVEASLPPTARVLVQYVPHNFGSRSMNLRFCRWVARVGRRRPVDVMFHEVAYPLAWRQPIRHSVLAVVHRAMAWTLLQSADRVLVSTAAWTPLLRSLGARSDPIVCPIPSNLEADPSPDEIAAARARWGACGGRLVGHFGTYGRAIAPLLERVIRDTSDRRNDLRWLLVGHGGEAFAARLAMPNVIATGRLDDRDAAAALAACEVAVQPYPDGITTRRSSAIATIGLGVPTITNAGALTEPLWRGQSGRSVVLCDSLALMADAIDDWLADPARRATLARASRALSARVFDLRHTVDLLHRAG